MFYEQFIRLCNEKGVSPSAAARAVGIDKSAVCRWAKGSMPRNTTLDKLAQYFGVSLGALLGYEPLEKQNESPKEEKPVITGEGLEAALEALRDQPGRRALLSATRNMTESQVLRFAFWLDEITGGDKD